MSVDTGRLRVVSAEAIANPEPRPRTASSQRAAADVASEGSTEGDLRHGVGDSADEYVSPGPYIKAQRKRRGMSLEQLAVATKIPRAQLELIEADRYGELPGMVFAKGFLRCCARTLELDPDTVLGLLYKRERAELRKRRRENASAATTGGRAQIAKPSARGRAKRRRSGGVIQAWLAEAIGRLPSARIVLWLVVALFVALVVFIAFTLASGQASTLMIRS